MSKQKTCVFKRTNPDGWTGQIEGTKHPIDFPKASAGTVYALMREKYPDVRVGFKSSDMGQATVNAFGEIIWMGDKPTEPH